jgi:hypothetical protein
VADPVRVRACSGAANQRWELTGIGELRGVNGLCIKVAPAQRWSFLDLAFSAEMIRRQAHRVSVSAAKKARLA